MGLAVIWGLLFILSSLILTHAVLKRKKYSGDLLSSFLIPLSFWIMFWFLCEMMIQILENDKWVLAVHSLKFVAIGLLPLLLFNMSYTKFKNKSLDKKIFHFLLGIFFIWMVLIFTNDMHKLFWSNRFIVGNGAEIVYTQNGVLFWVHAAYQYSLLIMSCVYFIKAYRKKSRIYRNREYIMILAILTTFIANILFLIVHKLFDFQFDFTPFTFLFTLSMIYYSVFLYKPDKVKHLARDLILTNINHGLIFVDLEDRIFDVNESFLRMIKKEREDVINWPLDSLNENLVEKMIKLKENPKDQLTYSDEESDSKKYYTLNYQVVEDNCGYYVGYVIGFEDTTNYQNMIEKLKKAHYIDGLTGIYNRSCFESNMEYFNDLKNAPMGFVEGDLNNLKVINDTEGHHVGDELIIKSGEILKQVATNRCKVFRMGGDEFLVTIPNATHKDIGEYINLVEAMILNTKFGNSFSMSLGYSIQKDEESVHDAIKRADEDMYLNKIMSGNGSRDNNIELFKHILAARTFETMEHLERTSELSRKFGYYMGLNSKEIKKLIVLTQVHDVGMILLPEKVLISQSVYTEEEREIMRTHCKLGEDLLKKSTSLNDIAYYVGSHHERWDGNGYPRGLQGSEIPYLSRILMIIDSYDFMLYPKRYRRALNKEEAILELVDRSGILFDPNLVKEFAEMFELEALSNSKTKV